MAMKGTVFSITAAILLIPPNTTSVTKAIIIIPNIVLFPLKAPICAVADKI